MEALLELGFRLFCCCKCAQSRETLRSGGALSSAVASQSSSTIIYGTHFNHGVWRLTAQYSNGLFAPGHGAPLTGQVFNNYFRLNGLGQTSSLTSLNTSIPTWAKWAAGIGGGAVITNQVLNHNKK